MAIKHGGRGPGHLSRWPKAAGTPAFATLDDVNIGAGIALSDGNLTATSSTASDTMTRSANSHSSGAWYYELTTTAAGGGANINAGFANGSASFAARLGVADTNAIAWQDNNGIQYGGTIAEVSTFGSGDIVQLFYDVDLTKFWVGKNGVWDGDPSARTGGYSSPAVTGAVYAAASFRDGSGFAVTVNFGATAFSYAVPTGGSAWGSA